MENRRKLLDITRNLWNSLDWIEMGNPQYTLTECRIRFNKVQSQERQREEEEEAQDKNLRMCKVPQKEKPGGSVLSPLPNHVKR